MSKLSEIQQKLNVPKSRINKWNPKDTYKYRSIEDILAAVKPLLGDGHLIVNDEAVQLCNRVYIKATASLTVGESTWSATAWAREADSRKGMDAPQITGTASTYAAKYALQKLFMLDNEDDPDKLPPISATAPAANPSQTPPQQEPAPWDGPPEQTTTPPPSQAPATPASQEAQGDGKVPAPNNEERKWLTMLWDYFVAQAQGQKLSKSKLLRLAYLHLNRHATSQADVELLKKYMNVNELVA